MAPWYGQDEHYDEREISLKKIFGLMFLIANQIKRALSIKSSFNSSS